MSNRPFRFVHAADFHLESPLVGISDVPEHLRSALIDAPYRAAQRVFETALAEEADFVLLSGDLLDAQETGPRGPLFLAEQFHRLHDRNIPVYWAGGRSDPPEAWPMAIPLPDNVCQFPAGRVEEHVFRCESAPLARLIGVSRVAGRAVRISDFLPDPSGLFSIGMIHGAADADSLRSRQINYWALGGSHRQQTLFHSPYVAHYPGSPQGRLPKETGPHGCTVVQVDPQRGLRMTPVHADSMRWHNETVTIEPTTSRADLQQMFEQQTRAVAEANPGVDLLITWRVVGSGPLTAQLRHGRLAPELLDALRQKHGTASPMVWSVSLAAEPPAVLDPEWYEQETLLGDFLREVRRYQMNADEPLDLSDYLADAHLAGTLGSAGDLSDHRLRERVLREAAMLGVDLLGGEEPQP